MSDAVLITLIITFGVVVVFWILAAAGVSSKEK